MQGLVYVFPPVFSKVPEKSMRGESVPLITSLYGRAACWAFTLVVAFCQTGITFAQEGAESVQPDFAPGVLTTIQPDVDRDDLRVVHDIPEIRANEELRWDPILLPETRTLYQMAEEVHFRRPIWCLQLSFKPLRMMYVDVPQPSGRMQRKLIWYLVYRVRNVGAGLEPEQQEDGSYAATEYTNEEIRFIPQFVLTSQDTDRQGRKIRKSYLDRIVPTALKAIEQREMPQGRLLNSVEMSEQVLTAETGRRVGGLWGVAIWEDVDPEIDFFSVFVGGLTNAYDWQNPSDFQAGDPPGRGRTFVRKQLQLNFWRPGDAVAEDEREIRFGVPVGMADRYDVGEGVAYRWVYR